MGAGFGIDIASSLLAGKPTIPQWNNISLADMQGKATQANLDNLPKSEALSTEINGFNQSQLLTMLRNAIPGFDSIMGNQSSTIQQLQKGQIPTDVASAVQDSAAARALTGGYGGAGLGKNLTARDLGLTSLDLTQRGLSSAQSWLTTAKSLTSPQTFDVSSMFITPQQEFQDTMENQTAQFQRDYVSNMNDWQHSIGVAAAQDMQDTVSTALSFISSYFGGSTNNKPSNVAGGGGGGDSFSGGSEDPTAMMQQFGGG